MVSSLGVGRPLRRLKVELQERVEAPEAISPRAEAVYELLVSRIQGAVATITWRSEDATHLWTAIASLDEDVAAKIYDVEALLQERFADKFDFYVHAGGVKELREFLPPSAQIRFLRSC